MNELVPSAGAAVRPVLAEVDGRPLADSRDIAARFGKRHADVLRSIDLLVATAPGCERNFAFSSAPRSMPNGGVKEERFCLVDRDGFAILAMGFTGSKAMAWKLDYISAFNAMEGEIRRRAAPAVLDLNDPGALRTLLLGYTEKVLALEAQVAVTEQRAATAESAVAASAPKVDFYDRFAEADGLYGLQNAGRAIGAPPNLFIRWLKEVFLFYQGSTLMPRAPFVKLGVFEVRVRMEEVGGAPRACSQTYVTPFGLQYLAKRWERSKLTPRGDCDLFGNAA